LLEQGLYDHLMLAHTENSQHLFAKTFAEIARETGKHPYDAALDILLAEGEGLHTAALAGAAVRRDPAAARPATSPEHGGVGRAYPWPPMDHWAT